MPLNELDLFRSAVDHRSHEGMLYYANFTPDLEDRVRRTHGLDGQKNLRDHFGMNESDRDKASIWRQNLTRWCPRDANDNAFRYT